ncbi:MAG: molybdopterin molybdotransferase MoeA [Desulfovibrio sp.]|jgi:molybdopterin molybdotransferase|nr:molybdopterin molybdotransferase MoeA [Desulfovibrio sp.]
MARFLTLQSVDSILEHVGKFLPLPGESLPPEEALNRVLAAPFHAPENLPHFSRSSMDGFAVRAKDVFGASEGAPALLDCVGECPMGRKTELVLAPGQTARIWTGGMLPEGADAVVMLEYSRRTGSGRMEQVELTRPVAPLDNVIAAGEDAEKGALLLEAGRLLRPQELGMLAAFGVRVVEVRRRARVAVISSGDEIVPDDIAPAPGQVRDINARTLTALVRAGGGEARFSGIAEDSGAALLRMLKDAMSWADVVLLSGGSSAGQRDCTLDALSALPGMDILAHGVAISPGKPLILARKGAQSFWGLPGHAGSALVCAEVFIRPLLRRLAGQGEPAPWRDVVRAVLGRPIASAQGRRDYIRVRIQPPEESGGLPSAMPIAGKSGLITTLTEADALVVCPEDMEGLAAGEIVTARFLL